MPHMEALHHMFGLGVCEIRTDTYILSPARPNWLMVVRGGTHFEIREKTAVEEPLSIWTTPVRSTFPLSRHIVRTLQDAFPSSGLPRHIAGPVDLISWLERSAAICTVSQRISHFDNGDCTAELTQVNVRGQRSETFCLSAKRYDTVVELMKTVPGPRLPNCDFHTWLQEKVFGMPVSPAPAAAPQDTAAVAMPVPAPAPLPTSRLRAAGLSLPAFRDISASLSSGVRYARSLPARLRQMQPPAFVRDYWRAVRPRPAPETRPSDTLQIAWAMKDDTPVMRAQLPPALPMSLSTRFSIQDRQHDASYLPAWRCSRESLRVGAH